MFYLSLTISFCLEATKLILAPDVKLFDIML